MARSFVATVAFFIARGSGNAIPQAVVLLSTIAFAGAVCVPTTGLPASPDSLPAALPGQVLGCVFVVRVRLRLWGRDGDAQEAADAAPAPGYCVRGG